MDKKVSIIVPVYKAELFLNRCVDSIIAQTYKNIEIILVDDGSPDNSGKLCDKYAKNDNRIIVIHQKNGGVSVARNAGLDIATGEYIQFVDSDDYIDNNMTETLVNTMNGNTVDLVICGSNRIVCGKVNELWGGNNFKNKTVRNICELEKVFVAYLRSHIINNIWDKLYKSSIAPRFSTNAYIGEDTEFVLKYMSKCNGVSIINDKLYNYVENASSVTGTFRETDLYEYIRTYNQIEKFCRKHFTSKFNMNELYFYNVQGLKSLLFHIAVTVRAKESINGIKRYINDEQFIDMMNKNKMKIHNINDKIPLFFIKHKMATAFYIFVKMKQMLKKTFPDMFRLLKKNFGWK